jgi:hypothetical protein
MAVGAHGIQHLPAAPAFQPYKFSNGWRQYNGGASSVVPLHCMGFYKLRGVVHLEGFLDKNGGSWVTDEVVLTLPPGYRPPCTRVFTVCGNPGTGTYRVDVIADGTVRTETFGSNPVGFLSLNGISFLAAGN